MQTIIRRHNKRVSKLIRAARAADETLGDWVAITKRTASHKALSRLRKRYGFKLDWAAYFDEEAQMLFVQEVIKSNRLINGDLA